MPDLLEATALLEEMERHALTLSDPQARREALTGYSGVGAAWAIIGRTDRQRALRILIGQDPDYGPVDRVIRTAKAAFAAGRDAEAWALVEDPALTDNDRRNIANNLSDHVAIDLGRFELALELIRRYGDDAGEGRQGYWAGKRQERDIDCCLAWLAILAPDHRGYPALAIQVAEGLLRTGRVAEATALLDNLVGSSSDDRWVVDENLAYWHARRGSRSEARLHAERLLGPHSADDGTSRLLGYGLFPMFDKPIKDTSISDRRWAAYVGAQPRPRLSWERRQFFRYSDSVGPTPNRLRPSLLMALASVGSGDLAERLLGGGDGDWCYEVAIRGIGLIAKANIGSLHVAEDVTAPADRLDVYPTKCAKRIANSALAESVARHVARRSSLSLPVLTDAFGENQKDNLSIGMHRGSWSRRRNPDIPALPDDSPGRAVIIDGLADEIETTLRDGEQEMAVRLARHVIILATQDAVAVSRQANRFIRAMTALGLKSELRQFFDLVLNLQIERVNMAAASQHREEVLFAEHRPHHDFHDLDRTTRDLTMRTFLLADLVMLHLAAGGEADIELVARRFDDAARSREFRALCVDGLVQLGRLDDAVALAARIPGGRVGGHFDPPRDHAREAWGYIALGLARSGRIADAWALTQAHSATLVLEPGEIFPLWLFRSREITPADLLRARWARDREHP